MGKLSGSGENSQRTLSKSPERDAESVVCEIFHKSFFLGTAESQACAGRIPTFSPETIPS